MIVGFNPYISNNFNQKQSPNFKSLKDGLIEAAEVANYTKAKLLSGVIYVGGYKPTVQNIGKNLEALEEAKKIAAKDKNVGDSIIDYLNEAKELLIEEARKLKIIK